MNKNIQKLLKIAEKPSRLIIGLMSGTSLDGLDVALCEISGSGLNTTVQLKEFKTVPYEDEFKSAVKTVFSKKQVDLQHLCLLNERIGIRYATIVKDCLKLWNTNPVHIDLIASHGQTIFHSPASLHRLPSYGNGTLQIGDGDHISVHTGIITLSDFRQKHVAAGGEGAPLAVYGDYLLFCRQGEERIMLNIGGISNFTYLPGDLDSGKIFSTDIGPGNTIMDAFIQQHFPGIYFDDQGRIAAKGKVHEGLLQSLKENNFFRLPFPKTTGPELFNVSYLEAAKGQSGTEKLSIEDTMCTLNRFSADIIADAVRLNFSDPSSLHIYSSGGGMHNTLLMQQLESQLAESTFSTTKELGIDPDAKEAVLFALLANECVVGDESIFNGRGNKLKGLPAISMGKISFPQ